MVRGVLGVPPHEILTKKKKYIVLKLRLWCLHLLKWLSQYTANTIQTSTAMGKAKDDDDYVIITDHLPMPANLLLY